MVVEILCGEVGRTGASAPTNLLVLEMPQISYVKYSTGANETTRTAYRALGKPDWTAARRAFLAERTISEWHAEAKCFFRRVSAIPRPQRLFSPHSFLARQKRMGCRRHTAPFRRRKDMARGAAVTALIIAPRLRCIRNAPPEAFRTNWCRKECAAFLCKKRNNPTPSRIEICRRGFLWMRPWSGRR